MSSADLPNGVPPQDPNDVSKNPGAPAKPPLKKKRRWLRYVVALTVVLILLAGLAPTLLSTGPGKSAALGVANKYLNGKVEIADWSLGWMSGIRANGVKVFDEKNTLILEVGSFKTDMSITDAARGKYEFGDTQVKGLNLVHVYVDENGVSNYQKLVKTDPAAPRAPKTAERSAGPIELPNVSGTLTVEYTGGKVEVAGVSEPVYILPGATQFKIPSINEPITNSVTLELQVGNAAPGSISIEGTSAIAKNNKLTLESANIEQNVTIKALNLATLQQIARMAGIELQAAGVANGVLQLKTAGVQNASLVGTINATSVALKLPQMRGDTYSSANVSIPIKMNVWQTGDNVLFKVEQLDVNADQCFVQIKADSSLAAFKAALRSIPDAIAAALSGRAPSGEVALDTGEGWVTITAGADIKALTDQLPHVFALQPGTKIDSGKMTHSTRLNLAKTDAPISSTTRIEIAGRNNGRQVTLQPIEAKVEANLIGLRDIGVNVSSGFLTVTGGGKTLKKTELNGKFDLAQISAELDPLINVATLINGVGGKPVTMVGSGEFAIGTDGDPTSPDSLINASVTGTIRGVNISGVKELPAIQQEFTRLVASAQVATKDLTTIQKASVALSSGAENAPFLDLVAGVNGLNLTSYACGFALQKMNVTDLARLQREFGGIVPALAKQGITIGEGQLSATVSGTYDGKIIKTDQPLKISAPSVTIAKKGADGVVVSLLTKEQLDVSVSAVVDTTPKKFSANIADLSVSTQSNILQLSKNKDAPLTIAMTPEGGMTGRGSLRVVSDAKRVSDLAQAFGGQTTSASPLKSGLLDATVTLNSDTEKGGSVELVGTIDKLSIATAQPIENQKLTFKLSGTSPRGFGTVVFSGDVNSSFVNAKITNGVIKPNAPTLEMLDSATIEVAAESLPSLQALANSFSVPVKLEPSADGTPAPGPITLAGGNMNTTITVTRDGKNLKIAAPGTRIGSLALQRDGRRFLFDQRSPITLDVSMVVNTSPDTTGKLTLMQQLNSAQVSQFKVNIPRIASLQMKDPITVTNLSTTPSANGSIEATTSIEAVAPLLAMLQGGEPLPYRGNLVVNQRIKSTGGPITVDGDVAIDKFVVMNGTEVVFAEEKLSVVNGIDIDTTVGRENIVIRSVEVTAPQSQAVSIKLTGQVQDYLKTRTIKGVGTDPAMTLAVGYDLEKAWKIIYPMLSPEQQLSQKDTKVAGKHQTTFKIAGMYPAKDGRGNVVRWNVSARYLKLDGDLLVQELQTKGLTITELKVPLTLADGKLKTSTQTPLTKCNGGTINLANIEANVGDEGLLVTTPPKLEFLKKVQLNSVLAEQLGKFGGVLFKDASNATGQVDMTVMECNALPVADLTNPNRKGQLKLVYSVTNLELNSPLMVAIAASTNISSGGGGGVKGNINNAALNIGEGQAYSDLAVLIGDRAVPLSFKGGMRLSDLSLRDFIVGIPLGLIDSDAIRKFVPSGGLAVPLTGTASNYKFDFLGAVGNKQNIGSILEGVLDKNKKDPKDVKPGDPSTQPGAKEMEPSLEDILKGLAGGKDKKDEKKDETPPPPPRRKPR